MALEEYRKHVANLSINEQKLRDLYLRDLALGKIQGPPTEYASLDKPWLKWYDEEAIQSFVPQLSIYENMINHTTKFSERYALEFFGKKIKYKEFYKKIDEAAKMLLAFGVKKGDCVSVCLPNIPEVGYIFYAINKIGAVANMLDPRTNASTLSKSVDDTHSKLLFTLDSVCDKFINSHASTIVPISAINSLPKVVQKLVKAKDKTMNVNLPKDSRIVSYDEALATSKQIKGNVKSVYEKNAPAVIAYTGGTTGEPKGVVQTNEAFNAMITENYFGDYDVKVGDRCINIAPPWTYYGLSNCFNAFLCMGVTSSLIPALGPDDLGKLIYKYKPNHVITVPSALIAVKNDKKLNKSNLEYLKTIIVGADKLDGTFEKEFNQFLKKHNSKAIITKGYGMTEVCAATTYTKKAVNTSETVGVPYIFENVSVFDIDTCDELPIGKRGEIAIYGPKNMLGYFGRDREKNDDVLKKHSDGLVWIHTGDIGHMDRDGKLYVDGRLKRMFVKNGFKIFPGEIENQILKNDFVEQAAVVSIDDESNGYIAKAFIVLKDKDIDHSDAIEQVYNSLRETLYDYEIPDSIDIIDKMPLTGMNKIDFKNLEQKSKKIKVKKL